MNDTLRKLLPVLLGICGALLYAASPLSHSAFCNAPLVL